MANYIRKKNIAITNMKTFIALLITSISYILARIPKSNLLGSNKVVTNAVKSALSSEKKDKKASKNKKSKSSQQQKKGKKNSALDDKSDNDLDAEAELAAKDMKDKKNDEDADKKGKDDLKEQNIKENTESSKLSSADDEEEEEKKEEEEEEEEEDDKKDSKLSAGNNENDAKQKEKKGSDKKSKGSKLLPEAALGSPQKSFMFDAAGGVQGAKKLNLITDSYLQKLN